MLSADQPQRNVTGKRHPADQHHHRPDVAWIQRSVGAEFLIGQQRQYDERHHRELQYGNEIAPLQLARGATKFGFEIQQHCDDDCNHPREARVAGHHHGAQQVTRNDCSHGRSTGVVSRGIFLPMVIGGHHHDGNRPQRHPEYGRRSKHVGQQGGGGPCERDERKGAQSGLGRGIALALQPDQQPDQERGQELGQPVQPLFVQPIKVHGLQAAFSIQRSMRAAHGF